MHTRTHARARTHTITLYETRFMLSTWHSKSQGQPNYKNLTVIEISYIFQLMYCNLKLIMKHKRRYRSNMFFFYREIPHQQLLTIDYLPFFARDIDNIYAQWVTGQRYRNWIIIEYTFFFSFFVFTLLVLVVTTTSSIQYFLLVCYYCCKYNFLLCDMWI